MGHEQMEDGESFCFLAQAVSEQHDPWWQDYWQRPYAHQQSGNDSLEDVGQIVTAERQLFGSAVPPLAKSVRGTGGNQSHGSQAGPFGVPHVARWDEIRRQRSPALRAPTSPASDQLSQAESRQARIPGHRSSRSLGESFWGGVSRERLAVVVADVEVDEEYQFEQPWYASNPEQLHKLAEWLIEQQVEEVVMESTAQYWKPLWSSLERYWKPSCQNREGAGKLSRALHLAQALSNRGRRGRKKDFRDAERLVKRLISQELVLSFVPDGEQRLWRTLTRAKYQRRRDKVRLQNQLEALLVSWVGACPREDETAGVNRSKRSPKGNRQMRRLLNQAANAAVKQKGSIFEIVYRRLVLRLGHNKTIGAIANRLCQLIWIILHKGVRYEERGPAVSQKSKRLRTSRMIRTLRTLGYRVEPPFVPA